MKCPHLKQRSLFILFIFDQKGSIIISLQLSIRVSQLVI